MARLSLGALLLCASLAACSGGSSTNTTTKPAGSVSLSLSQPTLLADGSSVRVTATVKDDKDAPATGSVRFAAAQGAFSNGLMTMDATLQAGTASVDFSCDGSLDLNCKAATGLVTAIWTSVSGSVNVVLRQPSTSNSDGGTTIPTSDGGTTSGLPGSATITVVAVSPATIVTPDAAPSGLATSATITFSVRDGNSAVQGAPVTFSAAIGEDYVTLGSTTAVTSAAGLATVTVNSKALPGRAHVVATLGSGISTAIATVGIVGPPASVTPVATTPAVLGVKGSGIQESGQATFLVADAFGSPVPGVQVDITQASPALVTLIGATARSDANGIATATYSSGSEVGVTSIVATAHGLTVNGKSPIAVRGARPSASGFYFRCEKLQLQVYDTVLGYETMECFVRLTDRQGNRVGIATPVNFAAEAGAIAASVTTKPFDFAHPDDLDEGTATVTFTTNMGNGFYPADVAPVAGEPRLQVGSYVVNPRDNLVTIIAWTQGEEAFVDANHNGQYDVGELFVDQGDPYLDENDDNQYDQVIAGGQWEPRFCGASTTATCPVYTGPNGKWDALTTIWAPTWVVFGGVMQASLVPPPGTGTPPGFLPQTCADFVDSGNPSTISEPFYAYDDWFNSAPGGTTVTMDSKDSQLSVDSPSKIAEHLGLMDLTYRTQSATGGACTTANGTACVLAIQPFTFANGFLGIATYQNAQKGSTPGSSGCLAPAVPVPFSGRIKISLPGDAHATGDLVVGGTAATP